jgi:hypothetical protein
MYWVEITMDQIEFTLVRYDQRGLIADTVVCAGKHEIQHLLDEGWRVVMSKPADANSLKLASVLNLATLAPAS